MSETAGTPDPEVLQAIADRVADSTFHRWAGLDVTRVAAGEVDVALDVTEHHLNLIGLLHGGMIATIADTAMGLALRTMLPEGASHVTVQLNIHFLSPARSGRVLGLGRVVRSGRRMGYAEADVVDREGKLLARASSTFIVLPASG